MIEASASLIWSRCAVFALAQPINFKPIDPNEVLGTLLLLLLMAAYVLLIKWLMGRPGYAGGFGAWYNAMAIAGILVFALLMLILVLGTGLAALLGF